jgi:PAS domain S-box-containing protein
LNYFVLLSLLAAIISFGLAIVVWQNHRDRLAHRTFVLLMSALGIWSFFQAAELSLESVRAMLWTIVPVYLGVFLTVAAWLVFALAYTGHEHWLTSRRLAWLAIEPAIFLVLLWTNPYHHLLWEKITLSVNAPYTQLVFEYGPAFWLHTLYSYALLLLGTLLILQSVIYSSRFYLLQTGMIILALLIPWGANALFVFGFIAVDLTAIAFSLTGLILAWGLLNLRLLDILPLARTAVFESFTDAILILDEQGRLIDSNPSARALLSLPYQGAIGQPVTELLPFLPELLRQPAPFRTEFYLEERAIYYELNLSAIRNKQRREVGRVVTLRDITARKLAERAEREQRALAEALRDVAAILNNSLDLQEVLQTILAEVGRVVPHDTANVMLLQGNTAKVVGYRGFAQKDLMPSPQTWTISLTPNLKKMLETRQPVIVADTWQEETWVIISPTDWIRSHMGAPILRDEQVLGFINLDSSTPNHFRPEYAEPLRAFASQAAIALWNARLFADLTARNEELDAYTFTIAHDLKSPLNLISGYAELLTLYDLPSGGQTQLAVMREMIARMGRMIEQLLFLAQLRDAKKTAVSLPITPIVYAALARFMDQIEARSVRIVLDSELLPAMGHAPWLEEVFANLISNAIKYIGSDNPDPAIHIRSFAQDNMVRYEICDNGLGISPSYQKKIFEMFSRFHKEEAAGTGLGLAIAQRIVQKLGGQVGVESTPGQGSAFWFTLPAPPP